MLVAAVPGVDNGDVGVAGGHIGGSLLKVAHGGDVGVAGIMRMVSATLSPLAAELLPAEENPSTLPPRRIMADSKLKRVRVLGS